MHSTHTLGVHGKLKNQALIFTPQEWQKTNFYYDEEEKSAVWRLNIRAIKSLQHEAVLWEKQDPNSCPKPHYRFRW